jgi:hypothetical protein
MLFESTSLYALANLSYFQLIDYQRYTTVRIKSHLLLIKSPARLAVPMEIKTPVGRASRTSTSLPSSHLDIIKNMKKIL